MPGLTRHPGYFLFVVYQQRQLIFYARINKYKRLKNHQGSGSGVGATAYSAKHNQRDSQSELPETSLVTFLVIRK